MGWRLDDDVLYVSCRECGTNGGRISDGRWETDRCVLLDHSTQGHLMYEALQGVKGQWVEFLRGWRRCGGYGRRGISSESSGDGVGGARGRKIEGLSELSYDRRALGHLRETQSRPPTT